MELFLFAPGGLAGAAAAFALAGMDVGGEGVLACGCLAGVVLGTRDLLLFAG